MLRSLRLLSAALVVLTLSAALGIAPAAASNDSTAPVVEGLTVSPSSIDTSGGAKTVTVTAHITDDLSGVSQSCCNGVSVNFKSPSGQYAYATFYGTQRTSGTAQDGEYSYTMTLPRYSEQGTWTVSSISTR